MPVGSVYHYFPDKEAIVEALALRYWSDFEDLVAGVAETDERDPLADPAGAVLETLAAGFRARPGLPGPVVRRPADRARSRDHPPDPDRDRRLDRADPRRPLAERRADAAPTVRRAMVVIAGDGLLREAFRVAPDGDEWLLEESRAMLDAYIDRPTRGA